MIVMFTGQSTDTHAVRGYRVLTDHNQMIIR